MDARLRKFYKRWKVPYNEAEQFGEFKNRVLNSFDFCLGTFFLQYPEEGEKLIKRLGRVPSVSYSVHHQPGLRDTQAWAAGLGKDTHFSQTRVYNVISDFDDYDFHKLIQIIEDAFYLPVRHDLLEKFYKCIKEDIRLSGVQVVIRRSDDHCVIYPKGAQFLDDGLVDDIFDWLGKYPKKVQNYFALSLKSYMDGHYRDSADKMRLSLESLLKSVLGNRKALKNQQTPLGMFLKDRGVPTEIRSMYAKLLFGYYSDYQDDYIKHDDASGKKPREISEVEAEFIICYTGIFMRLLRRVAA
jgi:hypothetical protein